jgi:tight adherence protein B
MVRDRKVLEGKALAVTSQGRMQAAIVGLLPIVFGYFVIKINPDMMRLMWTTVPGFVALTIILVLDIAGYFWTMKLSQIDY